MLPDFILALGILLVIFPFLLVFSFSDRLKGILVMSVVSIGFAICVPVLTETLHIFGYASMCILYAVFDAIVFIFFLKRKGAISGIKIYIPFIVALAIVSYELVSVHYGYTGQVETSNGVSTVIDDSYAYPQFSDEWVEAAIVSHAIETHSLPMTNPLAHGSPMPNLLLPFDSLIAGSFVLFGLSPISDFAILAILFGLAASVSLYIAGRCWGIGRFACTLSMLAIPFLTNSANLPGVWFLVPYIAATAPFFLMLAFLGKKDYVWATAAAFLSLVIYPPFAVFIAPTLLIGVFFELRGQLLDKMKASLPFLWPFAAGLLIGAILLLIKSSPSVALSYIQNAIFHASLDPGIPSYAIWNVIPDFVFPFIIIGFISIIKRRAFSVAAGTIVGITYWIAYAYYSNVIIIEYPRIVMITSLILLLVASFGFDSFLLYFDRRLRLAYPPRAVSLIKALAASATLVIFGIGVFWYPFNQKWQTFFTLIRNEYGTILIMPSLPINRYLAPRELSVWQGIHGANFTAPPWKGLVIGAATGNYPLESKPSTITVKTMPYAEFISADCAGKDALARRYSISYAYSPPFECPGFVDIKESSEGLHLYRYDM